MAKARAVVMLMVGITLMGEPAGATLGAGLQPHRAAYGLTLHKRLAMGPIVHVAGGLVIEWRLTCDGWLSNQRLSFVASTEDGESLSHDVRYSSWEANDGSRLRYSIRSFEGAEVAEEYRGEAWITPGSGGTAAFRTPWDEEIELPAGAVFPTEHLQQVIAEAKRGIPIVSHQVFDGWGFDALTLISTVIGKPQTLEVDDGEAAMAGTARAWPVSMAYFEVGSEGELPDFEAWFLLTENGVLRNLVLEYGDFRLDASMEDLELLPRPDC
jgi:hypothetical protein